MPDDPALILAPSLLAADFSVEAAVAVDEVSDWLHVDIMDNKFVPNLTIGLDEVRQLRAATRTPFDTHLMIVDPDRWATRYVEAGSSNARRKKVAAASGAPRVAASRAARASVATVAGSPLDSVASRWAATCPGSAPARARSSAARSCCTLRSAGGISE